MIIIEGFLRESERLVAGHLRLARSEIGVLITLGG